MPHKTTALVNVSPEVQSELESLQGLTRLTINQFGHGTANEVADLADEVCGKQTVARMGEIGKNITQILKLTESVDPDDFNLDKSKGLFGKAVGWFKSAKVDLDAHYKSVSEQIAKVADELDENVVAAARDNEFLERQHQAVQRQYKLLGYKVEALVLKEQQEQAVADAMAAKLAKDQNPDALELQLLEDQKDFVTKINKQADRLRRTQHIVLLQLPTIRSTQSGNLDAMDDLTTLREETLPVWKSLISTAAMGENLKQRVELSNAVKDKTNAMARKLADMTGQNMVDVAKMSQRSSFDIETIKHYQKTIITKGREAQKAIEAGAKERAAAIPLLENMRDELRKEYSPKK
jgi:uncharacterized protein YaaN involved in tellurite resistance